MSSLPLLASRSDLNSLNADAIHDDHDADTIQHFWPLSVRILHALLYGHRHKSDNKPGSFRCVWAIIWCGVAGWYIYCGTYHFLWAAGAKRFLPDVHFAGWEGESAAPDFAGWDHKAVTTYKSATLGHGVCNLLAGIETLVNAQFSVEFLKQQVSALHFQHLLLSLMDISSDWRRQWYGQ
jgi:hypothetical protein